MNKIQERIYSLKGLRESIGTMDFNPKEAIELLRDTEHLLREIDTKPIDILDVPEIKIGDRLWDVVLCNDKKYHAIEMKVCAISNHGSLRETKNRCAEVWNLYLEGDDYTYAYRSFDSLDITLFRSMLLANAYLAKLESEGKVVEYATNN